jgi:rhamnosyl/mannosyltransferase
MQGPDAVSVKILHLGKFSPFFQGGIETFLHDLNNALSKKQYLISDVLCFDESQIAIPKKASYNIYRSTIDFTISNAPISIDYLRWLKKHIHHYHIVHIHHPNPIANIALLLSDFKGKVIVHWHSDIVKQSLLEQLNNVLVKKMLAKADKIIVTSPNYIHDSPTLKPFLPKTIMIPLGFDPNRLKEIDFNKWVILKKQYQGKRIIFALGRQVSFKGYEYLIKAATHLSDDYMILIGGDGVLYEKHRNLIQFYQVADKVQLLGLVSGNDAAYYYMLCNIFALTSITRAESFGMVLIEAMSFKKPMISTDIPNSGVNWVNQNNETGFVIPCRDSQAIAHAIQTLCQNEAQLQQFGLNAYKRFQENFEINIIADKIDDLYQSLVSNSAAVPKALNVLKSLEEQPFDSNYDEQEPTK